MGIFRATVRLNFPTGSGGGTNTWHLRTVSADGTSSEIATLMGLIRGFYEDVAPVVPEGHVSTWDGSALQIATATPRLLSAAGWSVPGQTGNSTVGSNASMLCVTWRTELAARSGRGRTFIGPVAFVSEQGDGTPGGSYLTAVRTAAADLVTASAAASVTGAIGVWSEKLGTLRDITGSSVTDQFAVLRSRRS